MSALTITSTSTHTPVPKPSVVLPSEAPWDRLPNEPRRAYGAFREWLDAGPTRTVTSAVKSISPQTAYRHRVAWLWDDRAVAWDRYLAKVELDAQVEARKARAQANVQATDLMRQVGMLTLKVHAMEAQAKAAAAVIDETGNLPKAMRPSISAKDAGALARDAVNLSTLLDGGATQRIDASVTAKKALADYSEEELEAMLQAAKGT